MEPGEVANTVAEEWGRSTVYKADFSVVSLASQEDILDKLVSQKRLSSNKSISNAIQSGGVKSMSFAPDSKVALFYSLPYFQSSLFATTLEDIITELRILVECNTEMRITKTQSDMGLLIAQKYGIEQPPVLDELDGVNETNINSNEFKLYKLDSDRKFVIDVFMGTYIELSTNKSFKVLYDHVKRILKREEYLEVLCEDESRNKTLRKDLAKQSRQQKNHIKSVIYDADVIIDELKTQVEDAALMSEIRSRYVNNWQAARTEQHHQVIFETEFNSNDSISFFKRRSEHEHRVHNEMELLTNICINETLQKVEDWMEKYEKDMERIDLRIQIKKNEYQNMLDKRIGLEKTIEKHDQQMKEWVSFKDERERARLYTEKMNTSAIIVQSWWRGILVRRELGPFKQQKKKRGATKK